VFGQKPTIGVLGGREHTSTFIVQRIGIAATSEMLAIPFRWPADLGLPAAIFNLSCWVAFGYHKCQYADNRHSQI
jgi:hypothetical protein